MKNIKKIIALLLIVLVVLTSTYHQTQKTQAAGLTVAFIVAGCLFVGSACLGAAYLANPDDNKDLLGTMKDFANDTVENQKKLYEMEKANFQMVMDKAVDAGVGTCLVGPNGVHITAKQLQQQEYPEFDTWKGYKEKESEKPSGSLWKKFELGVELADMLIGLFSNSGSDDGSVSGGEDEQLYYTGDDGYIDRETGQLSVSFSSTNSWYDSSSSDKSEWGIRNDKYRVSWTQTLNKNARVCTWVNGGSIYIGRIPTDSWYESYNYRYGCILYRFIYGTDWGSTSFSVDNFTLHTHVWSSSNKEYVDNDVSCTTTYYPLYYTCHLDENNNPVYRMWDNLSTNIPVFENSDYAKAYMNNGSLEGLINGAPEEGLTPTEAPVLPSTVSPVRQYVNYFANTFSPSVMPYYVNYNIVNNWDGNDTTFNINDYTGVLVPTLTPAPDAAGKDTNVTNNILIVQTNILTEINETVTNIYNFFQIDVDYITEELQVDSDENPTGFDNLKNLLSEFESAFPADKFDAVTQELDLLYPKITIKVPKALDKFLKVGDDKIILEDGVKKIVLCDFNEYAIYFVRFRKFLEIVLRIGLIFYLLKELTVVFTVA